MPSEIPRPDLVLPRTHALKLIRWMATAPAREVEQVARLNLGGRWSGAMRRADAIDYICRTLLPLYYRADATRHARTRDALVKRDLLPKGWDPGEDPRISRSPR